MSYFFLIISDLFSFLLSGEVTRALFDKQSKIIYKTEPLREPKQRRLKSGRGSQIWKMDWIWLTASFPKMSQNERYKHKQIPLLIPPQPYLSPSFPLSLSSYSIIHFLFLVYLMLFLVSLRNGFYYAIFICTSLNFAPIYCPTLVCYPTQFSTLVHFLGPLCVCMCLCMQMCVHVCVWVSVFLCIVWVCICMCVLVCKYMHV